MLTININDKPFHLPQTWEEIIASGKYLDLMRALMAEAEPAVRQMNIFTLLTGFDPAPMDLTPDGVEQLSLRMVSDIFPHLNFIFDPAEVFVTNPLPVLMVGEVEHRGPADRLVDQTGEEWMDSYFAQIMYQRSGDIASLHPLVATNYDMSIAEAAAMDRAVTYGIYLWYGKCEMWWQEQFPWLFPEGKGKGGPEPTGREIRHMLLELAGNTLGADWDIILKRSRADIIDLLDRLEDKRIAAARAEEK